MERDQLPERDDPARGGLRPCRPRRIGLPGGPRSRLSARRGQSQQPSHPLASRTSLADSEDQPEVPQDLTSDLFVERAHSGQDPRDPARPVSGLQRGSQRRYPVSRVSLHRTAADPHRSRGLSLGQPRVILQRDRLALPVVENAKHSRDSRSSKQPGSFTLGTQRVRRGRAVSRIYRELSQLRLGHQAHEGFRALAVHTASVLRLNPQRTGAPMNAWYPGRASLDKSPTLRRC